MWRAERMLNELPPFLDGYEAICQAIALGDIDHAWDLARQFHKSAQPIKAEALRIYEQVDGRSHGYSYS